MIRDKLIELVKEVHPDIEMAVEAMLVKPLTGKEIAFSPVEMYRFLMCVENEFHIYFTAEEIERWKMRTLSDFENAVNCKLSTK